MADAKTLRIRALNDAFRTTLTGGKVYMTAGVDALPAATRDALIGKVKAFVAFSEDNDPWGEHDFGSIEHDGETFFWKIDYYDADDPDLGAEDASNEAATERTLTLMLAEEY